MVPVKARRNHSLVTRLSAGLIGLAVIPLLLTAAVTFKRLDDAMDADVLATAGSIMEAASDIAVRYRIDATSALAAMEGFRSADGLRDFLSRGGAGQAEIRAFARVDATGVLDLAWPPQEESLSELLASTPSLRTLPLDGDIAYAGPLPDGRGGSILLASRRSGSGLVLVALDLSRLAGYFARLRMAKEDCLALLDGAGNVLVQSQPAPIPQLPRPIAPAFLGAGPARTSISGRNYLVMTAAVPQSAWSVSYYRDEAVLLPVYQSLAFRLGAAIALSLIGAVFVRRLLRRDLTEPFADILSKMGSVAEGDYGKRVAGDWPDEFTALARSFNAMAESVGNHARALETSEMRYKALLEDSQAGQVLLRRALDEKEVLLKEIHHRVKNNLQIVASLLNLQAANIRDEADRELFRTSQGRVYSISLTHELLYQTSDLSSVEMSEYGRRLLAYLRDLEAQANANIEAVFGNFSLPLDKAMPCGLILNELVMNALKHGAPASRERNFSIRIHMGLEEEAQGGRTVRIAVEDWGPGLPANDNRKNLKGIGLDLVTNLAAQLDGRATWKARDGSSEFPGTRAEVTFPLAGAEQ
jgi:two-component sensor histidine kinase